MQHANKRLTFQVTVIQEVAERSSATQQWQSGVPLYLHPDVALQGARMKRVFSRNSGKIFSSNISIYFLESTFFSFQTWGSSARPNPVTAPNTMICGKETFTTIVNIVCVCVWVGVGVYLWACVSVHVWWWFEWTNLLIKLGLSEGICAGGPPGWKCSASQHVPSASVGAKEVIPSYVIPVDHSMQRNVTLVSPNDHLFLLSCQGIVDLAESYSSIFSSLCEPFCRDSTSVEVVM